MERRNRTKRKIRRQMSRDNIVLMWRRHIITAGRARHWLFHGRYNWLAFDRFNLSTVQLTAPPVFPPHSQYYSAHAAYCCSKLAQVLFSSHLHQELQGGSHPLSSCAVDPGMVNTALYRHLWTPLRLAQSLIARLLFRVSFPPLHFLLSNKFFAILLPKNKKKGSYLRLLCRWHGNTKGWTLISVASVKS